MTVPHYSWLTPPGASALALLFLHEVPGALFEGALAGVGKSPQHIWLRDGKGEVIDEVMACREDRGMILTLHGGAGVRQAVEAELKAAGLRAAPDPQPFGRTRFERMTLALLPGARGPGAAGLILEAARQGDALSDSPNGVHLHDLLEASSQAFFLIDTPRVQLWGPVNAGKSSLLNALCGRTLAVVGDEPGLTRDVIEGRVTHHGFELRLFDAPGVWAGAKLDDEALALARQWQGKADLTIELVPPGGDPPPHAWWYHSRVDESGLEGLSVKQPGTLNALKDRLVEHFFGALRKLPPERRFALHPEVRNDLQALAEGKVDADTLRAKWLSEDS